MCLILCSGWTRYTDALNEFMTLPGGLGNVFVKRIVMRIDYLGAALSRRPSFNVLFAAWLMRVVMGDARFYLCVLTVVGG